MVGSKVLCVKHGLTIWQGHVECSICHAVFQTQRKLSDHFAPPLCICGAVLMPRPMAETPFTARCLCSACYAERVDEPALPKGSPS